jgi:hypothetical protein
MGIRLCIREARTAENGPPSRAAAAGRPGGPRGFAARHAAAVVRPRGRRAAGAGISTGPSA